MMIHSWRLRSLAGQPLFNVPHGPEFMIHVHRFLMGVERQFAPLTVDHLPAHVGGGDEELGRRVLKRSGVVDQPGQRKRGEVAGVSGTGRRRDDHRPVADDQAELMTVQFRKQLRQQGGTGIQIQRFVHRKTLVLQRRLVDHEADAGLPGQIAQQFAQWAGPPRPAGK